MNYFEKLATSTQEQNRIPDEAYVQYGVKRGLRNKDGTGVLVGLTSVSTVVGYSVEDGKVRPRHGELYYRGIEINEIVKLITAAGCCGYERAAYVLLFGRLPDEEEFREFVSHLRDMMVLPTNFARDVLNTFRTNNIMNSLGRSVLTMYSMDKTPEDLSLPNQIRQAMELTARIFSLVPYAYHVIQHAFHGKSLIIHRPDPELSLSENFLRLLREDGEFTGVEARLLDLAFALHADHGGGNNSTFVTRAVTSTMTDIYSAIGAAIGSLKGPLHGGANRRVVQMMSDLRENVRNPTNRDQVRDYLRRILTKEAFDRSGKIYGLGHAVYTLSDPRAVILREHARVLAAEKGREDELAMYELVEREAPLVFGEMKTTGKAGISANVDFYSGFVYDLLGIPAEVFTPIFAIGRMVGWCAHRVEMLSNPVKIDRPAFGTICKHSREDASRGCPACRSGEK